MRKLKFCTGSERLVEEAPEGSFIDVIHVEPLPPISTSSDPTGLIIKA